MNASTHIVEIEESNAQQLLIEESMTRPVVVDFWADWCGPCKQLMPILEKLADEYQGAFLLAKVNADEHRDLGTRFGVRGYPTIRFAPKGEGSTGFEDYKGGRTTQSMADFINGKLGRKVEKKESGDGAIALTPETFDDAVKGKKAFVKFYGAVDMDGAARSFSILNM